MLIKSSITPLFMPVVLALLLSVMKQKKSNQERSRKAGAHHS